MRRRGRKKSAPVGVVSKLLRLLETLRTAPSGLQLREVARSAQLNKTTAYRFLTHLENEGYVFRDPEGAYMIGIKLMRLGSGATFHSTLRSLSRPTLRNLASLTGETINLGVLDGQEVHYLDVIESTHSFCLVSHVGTRRPLHCTALGKAMLAFLPEDECNNLLAGVHLEPFTPHTLADPSRLKKQLPRIREQGYAVDDQESYLGARCIGAPIFDANGKVAAAVSVSAPNTRITPSQVPTFAKAVRKTAAEISAQLGYTGTVPGATGPIAAKRQAARADAPKRTSVARA